MADSGYVRSGAISVTLNKWYSFTGAVVGDSDLATWRVKLRYETEAANELDGTSYPTMNGDWLYFGYCFQAQYTDPDFRIYLIATSEDENTFWDNISFKEVLLYGAVDFKYDYEETRRNSDWIRLNPQAVITPVISANDFRIKFKAIDYRATGLQLDYMNVRYKLVDKRGVRGLHGANENVG
jgi:hypothetical protein